MKKGFYVFEPMVVLVTFIVLVSIPTTTLKPKLELLENPPLGEQASTLARASLDAELQQVYFEAAADEAAVNAVYDLYDGTAGGDPCLQSRQPQVQELQKGQEQAYFTYLSRRLEQLAGKKFAPVELSLLDDGVAGIAKKATRYELRKESLEGYYEYRHSFFVKLQDITQGFRKGEQLAKSLSACNGRTGPDLDVCAAQVAEKEGVRFSGTNKAGLVVSIDGPVLSQCVRRPELLLRFQL